MTEENRNEFNAIVSVLGDVLVELQGMREAFDHTMNLVLQKLAKLDSIAQWLSRIETSLEKSNDHEERLRKLGETVFRKGA